MTIKKMQLPFKLILASSSPRRKQLLEEAGYDFTVKIYEVDETADPNWDIEKTAELIALRKANEALKHIKYKEDYVVLTADTTVICDGELLGKPTSRSDAASMLRKLSNNKHLVVTGVAMNGIHQLSFHETTEVYFDHITNEEISYYIDQYQPFDKAGAYGIQQWIGHNKIKKIVGSYTNVMGLPVQKIYQAFELFAGNMC